MPERRLPLSRFKVLDLTVARAGPTTVRQLGDWGAQVIRIERPSASGGEEEELGGKRDGFDFQNLHRNKRSLTLDLKSPKGKDIFMRLAAQADVIVENMRANVKHRLGIDYESVRAVNPRIVYGSISGFGQEGPYVDRPGVDQIIQGVSGLMSITGLPGQGPVRAGIAIADLSAGGFLAQAILIALLDREVTGEGAWVRTSLLESLISLLDFQAARYLIKGDVPRSTGNEHPTSVPTGVFATSDGHINIGAGSQIMWKRLCAVLDIQHLHEDPRFKTQPDRIRNREEVNKVIAEIIRTKPGAHWVETLNAAGVPCGPIYSIDDMFEDEQVKLLNMARPVDHPRMGRLKLVGQPFSIGDVPQDMRCATPELGAHTDEIMAELGFDVADVDLLRKEGVI